MQARPFILTVDVSAGDEAYATIDDGSIESSQQKVVYRFNRDMVTKVTEMLYAAIQNKEAAECEQIGKTLAGLVLPKEIRERLPEDGAAVVLSTNEHDVPWELLWDKNFLGLRYAMGRQLLTTKDIKRPYDAAQNGRQTRCLIIANPTGDLPEAQSEAVELMRFYRANGVMCTLIAGSQVTSADLLVRFGNGGFDIIHYSGHIDFNDSGAFLRLAGEDRFYLKDALYLDDFGRPFVFLNGCGGGSRHGGSAEMAAPLIYAGSGPILCAAMPISDKGGRLFAECIIENVLKGVPYGKAAMNARLKFLNEIGIWAGFAFYGNPADAIAPAIMHNEDKQDKSIAGKLSKDSVKVLGRAHGLASDIWDISTSHLFLALLMQDDDEINRAFETLSYNARRIEAYVAAKFAAPSRPEVRALPDEGKFSDNALKALNEARAAAIALRREIQPKDIFIALISSPNMITQLLGTAGVDCAALLDNLPQ